MTTFLPHRGHSSQVLLLQSPPSIAAAAAGGLCLQPTTISLRSSACPSRSARASQKPLLPRRPSPSRFLTPPRVPRPRPVQPTAATLALAASSVPTVPKPSDRDCKGPVGTSLLRLPLGDTTPESYKLDVFMTMLNWSSLIPSSVINMPIESGNSRLS